MDARFHIVWMWLSTAGIQLVMVGVLREGMFVCDTETMKWWLFVLRCPTMGDPSLERYTSCDESPTTGKVLDYSKLSKIKNNGNGIYIVGYIYSIWWSSGSLKTPQEGRRVPILIHLRNGCVVQGRNVKKNWQEGTAITDYSLSGYG